MSTPGIPPTTQTTQAAVAPDKPKPPLVPNLPTVIPLIEIYTLHYRHGMSAYNIKNFHFKGSLKEALERARRHCDIMGYRCILVRPFITDINYEERFKLERGVEPLG